MYCLIVRRGDFEGYDRLFELFGERMPVIWERRQRDRRRTASVSGIEERRQRDRRGAPPPSWAALGFVVVERNGRE